MPKKTNFFLLSLLVGSALFAQSPASPAPPTNAWLKAGGNLYSQNFSPLAQINRQNVANLKAVWRARLDGSGADSKYSGEAQPVFYQGIVYIVTGADDVFATSLTTGEALWKYHAELKVSGVTRLATSARTFRPNALAFTANLRR